MSLFAQVLSSEYDLLLSWDFVVAKIKTFMYVCVYVGGLILLVIPVMPVIFAEVGCTLQPQHLQTPASLIDWTSTMSSSRWWSSLLLGQGELEWCAHDALLYGSALPGIHQAVPLRFSSLFPFGFFFSFPGNKKWLDMLFLVCLLLFPWWPHDLTLYKSALLCPFLVVFVLFLLLSIFLFGHDRFQSLPVSCQIPVKISLRVAVWIIITIILVWIFQQNYLITK